MDPFFSYSIFQEFQNCLKIYLLFSFTSYRPQNFKRFLTYLEFKEVVTLKIWKIWKKKISNNSFVAQNGQSNYYKNNKKS